MQSLRLIGISILTLVEWPKNTFLLQRVQRNCSENSRWVIPSRALLAQNTHYESGRDYQIRWWGRSAPLSLRLGVRIHSQRPTAAQDLLTGN